MARVIGIGRASRILTAATIPTVCLGFGAIRQQPLRCDTVSSTSKRSDRPAIGQSFDAIQPRADVVRQVSSGSLVGFGTGLVVALFSRTLAVISGLCAISLHVASRFGFDISRTIGLRDRLMHSSLWGKSVGNPWFSAMFALTFTLAAFVHL